MGMSTWPFSISRRPSISRDLSPGVFYRQKSFKELLTLQIASERHQHDLFNPSPRAEQLRARAIMGEIVSLFHSL